MTDGPETVLGLVVLLFPLSEIALALFRRARPGAATVQDRGTMRLLWVVILSSVAMASALSGYSTTRLRLPAAPREIAALILLGGGLALRWSAILTLGRFFTADVAIHQDHRVVDAGPYRYIRHPSYTGLLLAFLGLGVFFDNWLSVGVLIVPITLAILHRIRLEESVLCATLGAPYYAYRARTKRLIPHVL